MNTHDKIELPAEYRSGNSIPVERATFTRERMQEVLEAYADARVRVALEEALIEVMRCKTSGIIRNDTVDKCADAIRALIPKEPPCET